MATAYVQTTTFLKDMRRLMEDTQDVFEKQMFYEIITIIDTEFAAMAAATDVDSYEVTTGLNASMDGRLINIPSLIKRRCLEELFTLFTVECAAVETDGLTHTTTSYLSLNMKRIIQAWPDIRERKMLYKLVDQLDVEWLLVVAAAA